MQPTGEPASAIASAFVANVAVKNVVRRPRPVLDDLPIRWQDEVWLQWHVDDGYMLERYAERDEALMGLPPQRVGEGDVPPPAAGGG